MKQETIERRAFEAQQARLNKLTNRKCVQCKGFLMQKKQMYCSNSCSYQAYLIKLKRNALAKTPIKKE